MIRRSAARDVLDGLIGVATAARDHGVVIAGNGADEAATEARGENRPSIP